MFYVGQAVVAIKDHSQGFYKKGDEFIIKSIVEFPCCKAIGLDIGNLNPFGVVYCDCYNPHIECYNSRNFAPKIDLSEFTSESLIKELEQELVNI